MPRAKRVPAVPNQLAVGLMLQYLIEHGDGTTAELVHHSGLHEYTVGRWMRCWKGLGLVRIGGWDRDNRSRPSIIRWSWGGGRDAKRPCLDPKVVRRNWAARKRAKKLAAVFAATSS